MASARTSPPETRQSARSARASVYSVNSSICCIRRTEGNRGAMRKTILNCAYCGTTWGVSNTSSAKKLETRHLVSYKQSNSLRDQVVVGVADDFDAGEFADGQVAADVDAAVDVRRVGFAARNKIAALELTGMFVGTPDQAVFPGADASVLEFFGTGFAFYQDVDFAANERFRNLHGDFVLG